MKLEATAVENLNNATREKNLAAMSSVAAAITLTLFKAVVGILTGSLGILAEAAHSGLDLAAAAMTFFAVRISGRPADSNHPYGHGKVENLSALFETLLLLATSVWIIYEAIVRLFFEHVQVEVNIWSFVVMTVSIGIDISRSRMLARVAKKFESQALEADALHFQTDIWSSAVVIMGLVLIVISEKLQIPWLARADALAAIVVACIVAFVSYELGRSAVGELLDEIPKTLIDDITRAASLPGVEEVLEARARRNGPKSFVDLSVAVNRATSAEEAHLIAQQAEQAVQKILPNSNVLVHVVPVRMQDESLVESLITLGRQYRLRVHNIRVVEAQGKQILTLHIELPENIRVEDAHATVTSFEDAIRQIHSEFDSIVTHLEPILRHVDIDSRADQNEDREIENIIFQLPQTTGIDCEIHDVVLLKEDKQFFASFHCVLHGDLPVINAHEMTEQLELALRNRIPNLGQAVIHIEPKGT